MLELIKTLCAVPGVTGDESEMRKNIREMAKIYADDLQEDVLGNIIVYKKGKRRASKKIMLCAHMDEVGLIATGITDEGYVKFAAAGGIDKRVLPGKRVLFGETAGVIGVKPVHLSTGAEKDTAVAVNDMFIDIGADSKSEAMKYVTMGDTAVFETETRVNNGYLYAKAIDDRFGCAVLLELLKSELPLDCVFAFTVQEEVGTRGAVVAANRVKPDIALVVEATTAADLPVTPVGKQVCKLGGGAVVPFMDGGTIYDRELWKMITNIAVNNEIVWQTKEYISGGTDAAAIQRSGFGVQTAGIAAPVRNLHSPVCVAKISDLDAVALLVRTFVEELGVLYGVDGGSHIG